MTSMSKVLLGGSCLSSKGGLDFHIPSNYGFVVLTGVGSMFMMTWKAVQVGMARKKYGIPYPIMYATEKDSKDYVVFNCIQRAHQNSVENYPHFLALLALGGLEMPVFCSIAGAIWIAGRIVYAKGYQTGDPKKRERGAFYGIGLLMLLGATCKFAWRLIRKE